METIIWITKWWALSGASFLIVFMLCCLVKDNKLMDISVWRVIRFSLYPIINTCFTVCCIVLLVMSGIEKLYQYYEGKRLDKKLDDWVRKNCNQDIEKETYL